MRGLEAKIHRDCLILWSSDVFFWGIHRNLIFLLNPDVSGMYGFWNIHRKCPHLGPFRCIVTLVSVGDTSGLRFQCPSRCTEVYNTTYTVDTRYYFFDAFVMVLPASGHRNFTFFITLVWLYLMMDMIFPRFPFLNLVVPIGEPFSIPFCIVAMLF